MNIHHPKPDNAPTAPKEPYRAPHLTVHGQLQRLTLDPGGSIAAPNTADAFFDNGVGTGNGN